MNRRFLTTCVSSVIAVGLLAACTGTRATGPTPEGPFERGERYGIAFDVEGYSYITWDPTNGRLIVATDDIEMRWTSGGFDLDLHFASLNVTGEQTVAEWAQSYELSTGMVVYDMVQWPGIYSDPSVSIFGDAVLVTSSFRDYPPDEEIEYISASTGDFIETPPCAQSLARGVAACDSSGSFSVDWADGSTMTTDVPEIGSRADQD